MSWNERRRILTNVKAKAIVCVGYPLAPPSFISYPISHRHDRLKTVVIIAQIFELLLCRPDIIPR
jgi:hypothetical protein